MSEKSTRPRRITSVAEVSGKTISRHNALDLMKNAKGSFFSAIVTKKDGTQRKINGQYLKDQEPSELGYIRVKELSKIKSRSESAIRSINLQTIEELTIKGQTFKIK